MVKIKVYRAGPGCWRADVPVLQRFEGGRLRRMVLGGWMSNGRDAIRFAGWELQNVRRYLATGWVAVK